MIRPGAGRTRGAREAIERLAAEPGVVQSVLTGNIEVNAALKLERRRSGRASRPRDRRIRLRSRVRAELVAVARRKAEQKHGIDFAPRAKPSLIGDTPLDVAAARGAGTRVVAVASGPYDEGELREAGAEVVLPDLLDAEKLVAAPCVSGGRGPA